jgi:hypothetical protein
MKKNQKIQRKQEKNSAKSIKYFNQSQNEAGNI